MSQGEKGSEGEGGGGRSPSPLPPAQSGTGCHEALGSCTLLVPHHLPGIRCGRPPACFSSLGAAKPVSGFTSSLSTGTASKRVNGQKAIFPQTKGGKPSLLPEQMQPQKRRLKRELKPLRASERRREHPDTARPPRGHGSFCSSTANSTLLVSVSPGMLRSVSQGRTQRPGLCRATLRTGLPPPQVH